MKDYGKKQGDMSPHVEDYQKPMSDYSQSGFTKTTEYIARQDKQLTKMASGIKKQAYQGRYS